MRKQPVTRRQFWGSGIAAAGAISIGGALSANARDWKEYSARFNRSISDGVAGGSAATERRECVEGGREKL
jgi:hypothetical protein